MGGTTIVDYLKSYDRKERAWLIRTAFGANRLLSEAFLNSVSDKLGINPFRHEETWWGMDYHLSWLRNAFRDFRSDTVPRTPTPDGESAIRLTVQDVDLVLADAGRVVLIEAKADGAWSNNQMRLKIGKLKELLGDENRLRGPGGLEASVHLLLMSWHRPQKLDVRDWPSWALDGGAPRWVRLDSPAGFRLDAGRWQIISDAGS